MIKTSFQLIDTLRYDGGKFSDELKGEIVTEVVGLRSKCYAVRLKMDKNKQNKGVQKNVIKKAKGVKKNVLDKTVFGLL